jgi:hypothetical protein
MTETVPLRRITIAAPELTSLAVDAPASSLIYIGHESDSAKQCEDDSP